MAAVEYSESLALDAMKGNAPTVWMVLTQADPDRCGVSLCKSIEQVMRAVRRRWKGAEYALLVEFTTGYGPKAGGRRRAHFNVVWKGIPVEDLEDLRLVVLAVWCARESAKPVAQWFDTIESAGGLMRYVALHFLKESQAPPASWRGRRFRSSQGYFTIGRTAQKRESVASLRSKRHLRSAEVDGYRGEVALEVGALRSIRAKNTTWQLVRMRRSETYGVEIEVIEGRPRAPQLKSVYTAAGERQLIHVGTGEVWRQ